MSALRDIIKSFGGSFEKAPNKASFWMPLESGAGAIISLASALQKQGRQIKFVRFEKGWNLYRFVGQRDTSKRTFRVYDVGATNNVDPHLTMTVFKNGVVEIREKRRKQGFQTTVCAIYIRCMLNAVMKRNLEKARAKKAKKKSRR